MATYLSIHSGAQIDSAVTTVLATSNWDTLQTISSSGGNVSVGETVLADQAYVNSRITTVNGNSGAVVLSGGTNVSITSETSGGSTTFVFDAEGGGVPIPVYASGASATFTPEPLCVYEHTVVSGGTITFNPPEDSSEVVPFGLDLNVGSDFSFTWGQTMAWQGGITPDFASAGLYKLNVEYVNGEWRSWIRPDMSEYALKSEYLPLSGGTLSGVLYDSAGYSFRQSVSGPTGGVLNQTAGCLIDLHQTTINNYGTGFYSVRQGTINGAYFCVVVGRGVYAYGGEGVIVGGRWAAPETSRCLFCMGNGTDSAHRSTAIAVTSDGVCTVLSDIITSSGGFITSGGDVTITSGGSVIASLKDLATNRGVTSLNNVSGAVVLSGGTNVTISESTSGGVTTFTFNASGGGGGGTTVTSVNGKTGNVVLGAEDVGAVKIPVNTTLTETLSDSGGYAPSQLCVYSHTVTSGETIAFDAPANGEPVEFKLDLTMPDPAVPFSFVSAGSSGGVSWPDGVPDFSSVGGYQLYFEYDNGWIGWKRPEMTNYLNKTTGGTITGPIQIDSSLVVSGGGTAQAALTVSGGTTRIPVQSGSYFGVVGTLRARWALWGNYVCGVMVAGALDASGEYSFAAGDGARAHGRCVAVGASASAWIQHAQAIGESVLAYNYAMAIGSGVIASSSTIVLGRYNATSMCSDGIVVGCGSNATSRADALYISGGSITTVLPILIESGGISVVDYDVVVSSGGSAVASLKDVASRVNTLETTISGALASI